MQRGFSLVELSIVLVILGLLTGGILAGQSLIQNAAVRSLGTDAERYRAAVANFRDKYTEAPGDLTTATSYWGDDNSNCPDAAITNGVPGACNGNGNNILESAATGSPSEYFQFWKHLALAGLIEGSYSGVSVSGNNDANINVNVPLSRVNGIGFSAAYLAPGTIPSGGNAYVIPSYGNMLLLGSKGGTAGGMSGKGLTAEDAYALDRKLDDGKPAYGMIIARYWNNECAMPNSGTVSASNLDASYRLSDTTLQCSLHFIDLF